MNSRAIALLYQGRKLFPQSYLIGANLGSALLAARALHRRRPRARPRPRPAAVVDARAQQPRPLLRETKRLRPRPRLLEPLAVDRAAPTADPRRRGRGKIAVVSHGSVLRVPRLRVKAFLGLHRVEQLQNPLVLVRPTGRLDESVVLDRIRRDLPIRFAQLDQPLREADAVLEVHVRVDHAVADQQASFQSLREVDRRRLPIRLGDRSAGR